MTDATDDRGDAKAEISFDDFMKVDLRVATVLEAAPHPNADKLLVLQVDLGDEKRQILAGIRAYEQPEDLVGRQIVVVANLAPRKMRGLESQGMLLAASAPGEGDQRDDVVTLTVARPVLPGSTVS
jgi:methionyl-tRNA synthetase